CVGALVGERVEGRAGQANPIDIRPRCGWSLEQTGARSSDYRGAAGFVYDTEYTVANEVLRLAHPGIGQHGRGRPMGNENADAAQGRTGLGVRLVRGFTRSHI